MGLRTKLLIQFMRKGRGPTAEPLYNKAAPQLYIGGWPKTQGVLPGAGVGVSVVDVTCELPRTHDTGGGYLCVPTWGEALMAFLFLGFVFVSKGRVQGITLLWL